MAKRSVEGRIIAMIAKYGVEKVETVCLTYRLALMPPQKKERKIKEVKQAAS